MSGLQLSNMKFISGILACLVTWVGVSAKGIPFSGPLEDGNDLFAQLAPHLSSGAAIILPGDPLIAKHQRWQAYSRPRYSAVVEVATESDIGVVVGCYTHSNVVRKLTWSGPLRKQPFPTLSSCGWRPRPHLHARQDAARHSHLVHQDEGHQD